jgi:HAD superfamily phosphoserine phosphatase-like hydrolase
MVRLDLSRASVFLDFDGTISERDVGLHLLERLTGDAWHGIEELFVRQEIGSRECGSRQWALLAPFGRDRLAAVAGEVALDPGLESLVSGLRAAGAEVMVVSDGFGFYVWDVGERLGVPVRTARVDWETGELDFAFLDPGCPCAACGTCKRVPVLDARDRDRTVVFVGDGTSDRPVAALADLLFAKDALATWCDANDVAFKAFSTLTDVAVALGVA